MPGLGDDRYLPPQSLGKLLQGSFQEGLRFSFAIRSYGRRPLVRIIGGDPMSQLPSVKGDQDVTCQVHNSFKVCTNISKASSGDKKVHICIYVLNNLGGCWAV